jgi:membrane-associated phospholipid phosphatase
MEVNTFYLQFEPLFIEFLQGALSPFTETLAQLFTMLGEEAVLIAVLGFIYWGYDKEYGKFVGTNMVAGLVFCPLIKNVVKRNRPYMAHPNVKCIRPVHPEADPFDITMQGYSFPSIHSANAALMYGSIAKYKPYNKVLKVLAIVLPLLVGLSRIILGDHYPTDVLGGYIIAVVAMEIVSRLQQYRDKRWLLYLVLTLGYGLGIFFCRTEDFFTSYGIMIGFFIAVPFEEHFVKFENTKSIFRSVLRLLGGAALYVIINTGLKYFAPTQGDLAPLIFRMIRYAIVLFLLTGVYPLVFRYTGKLFEDKEKETKTAG